MNIKKSYYYLFYKLYRFSEAAPSKWWSEWKALLVINVLTYFTLLSVGGYYTVITKKDLFLDGSEKSIIISIVSAVTLINYFVFNYNEKWRGNVHEFDKWPKKKNRNGSIAVGLAIFLVLANLIFMFYLMSRIDWAQYR